MGEVERDFLGTIVKRRSVAGLRLTETVLPQGSRSPKHSHPNGFLGWALKGAYTNAYHNGAQEVHDSRVMFCPAGELHTTSTEAGALTFALEFDGAWMERFGGASLPGHPVALDVGSMASLSMRIHSEFAETDGPSALAIEGLALEMIAAAMRVPSIPNGHVPRWLAQAREILTETFSDQISIHSLADQVQIHPVYLASTFRHKYGCSITDYLRQLRVSYATRQLSDSDDSLAAIAQTAGFSDQSHFSRIFKRLTGTTPAVYRSNSRKKPS